LNLVEHCIKEPASWSCVVFFIIVFLAGDEEKHQRGPSSTIIQEQPSGFSS